VVATIAMASLAGNPIGGALADRWTPRRALMAGLAAAAAGSAALALARSARNCSGWAPPQALMRPDRVLRVLRSNFAGRPSGIP